MVGASAKEYKKQINAIEKEIIILLDEFVISLQKSKSAEHVENKASELAKRAQTLAFELKEVDKEELEQKSIHLDNLLIEADKLIESVPNAILNHEQQIWTKKIEKLNVRLVELKQGLKDYEKLKTGSKKKKFEDEIIKTIKIAKREIEKANHAILHKKHAQDHHLYLSLLKIRKAMSSVKGHIAYTVTEFAKIDRREPLIKNRAREIINTFMEQQNGKIFIDNYFVELNSTDGDRSEWEHDDITKDALRIIFENSNMFDLIEMRNSKNKTINAKFRVVDESGGQMIEMNGGCRTIFDDRIEFSQTKALVAI